MKNKAILFLCLLSSFILILSGCLNSEAAKDEKIVVATILPEFQDHVKSLYGTNSTFEIEFKSVLSTVEEVSEHWHDLDEVMSDYLQDNKDVDILFGFPSEYLEGLTEKGNLKNLSKTLDPELLEKMAPSVMGPIKKAGDGDVYALTPTFNNQILVYNKSIFKDLNIQEPKDSMTWEETAELAQKIQDKSNYKGIALGFPSDDQQFYYLLQSLNDPLKVIQNDDNKPNVNNNLNEKYWSLFSKLYVDNKKATGEEFVKGEVAMAIMPLNSLIDSKFLEFYGDYDKKNWGLVGVPVFEENKGGLVFSDSHFALSKYSKNKKAVSYLEFIHGRQMAELYVKSSLFPSYWDEEINRTLTITHGYDFSPAFTQPGALFPPPEFKGKIINEVTAAGAEYFVDFMNGKKDIKKALKEYEDKVK